MAVRRAAGGRQISELDRLALLDLEIAQEAIDDNATERLMTIMNVKGAARVQDVNCCLAGPIFVETRAIWIAYTSYCTG